MKSKMLRYRMAGRADMVVSKHGVWVEYSSLIAAAPDMLEALIEALTYLHSQDKLYPAYMYNAVVNAIYKAEGKHNLISRRVK